MPPPPAPPSTPYTLTLLISGPGLSPEHRSHWSFLLYAPSSHVGTILEVQLISLEGLIYQFEEKTEIPLDDPMAEGRVWLADVAPERVGKVNDMVGREGAPGDGKVSCLFVFYLLGLVVGLCGGFACRDEWQLLSV